METLVFLEKVFSAYSQPMFIELRGIKPAWAPPARRITWYFETPEALVNKLPEIDAAYSPIDLYFGVLPRKAKQGYKESVTQGACVWADVDSKQVGGLFNAFKKFDPLSSGILRPSLLCFTGNGYHGYWLLDRPTADIDYIEAAVAGLGKRVCGDHVHNANRLLRLPGSFNWKDKDFPKQCELIAESHLVYQLESFQKMAGEGRGYMNNPQNLRPLLWPSSGLKIVKSGDLLTRLGTEWTKLITEGIQADTGGRYRGDRSSLDLAASIKLLKAGYTEEEVIAVMTNPAFKISEKTLEKYGRARIQYLTLTISKAKSLVCGERE